MAEMVAEMVSLAEGIAEVVHCDVNHLSINGMQGVRGSNPFCSTTLYPPAALTLGSGGRREFRRARSA